MWSQLRRVLVVVVTSLAFAACGGGGGGPKGSDNTVAASVSPTGAVSVYLNKSQSISITFGTSDGRSASALSASGGLASLPAGWTGPAGGFECPVVGAGATCTLALQYLPMAPAAGTFVLGFSYRANNGAAKQGSVTIDYSGLSPTLELLAGSIGGQGNLDGTGATARFYNPWGMAVGSDGTVYVADSANHTIRKITAEGVVTTLAGTPEASGSADGTGSAARFSSPAGIAVDSVGTVYVADTLNGTIRKISPQGVVTTLAGSPNVSVPIAPYACAFTDGIGAAAAFCGPEGIAVDRIGTVYVADTQNSLIRKVSPDGVVTTLAGTQFQPPDCLPAPGTKCPSCPSADGTGGSAGFCAPHGIAVGSDGTVYVSDGIKQNRVLAWSDRSNTIRKVTSAGVVSTLAGRGYVNIGGSPVWVGADAVFDDPNGISVDNAGTVSVADTNSNTIRRISPDSVVTTLAGTVGTTGSVDGAGPAARFASPRGIAVDSAGTLYVADTVNGVIRKITSAGSVMTFAGAAPSPGFADGTGGAARFSSPHGIAVDTGGTVYAADSGNNTIRKITPAGVVTTFAGTASEPGFADGTGAAARFTAPDGIAVDATGTVYVTDSYDAIVRKITPGGAVTTLAGTPRTWGAADGAGAAAQFGGPAGVAVDSAGTIYVADGGNNTIRKITREGFVTTLAGLARMRGSDDGIAAAARFNYPQGVAVDNDGAVSVADSYNCTIRRLTQAGAVTTLAGAASFCGSEDGAVAAARFNHPIGLAFDTAGNLYVSDFFNHAIRKITPAGNVTTVLGDSTSAGVRLGSFPASLGFPRSLAVRPDGQLVIADGSAILVTRGL